MRDGPRGFRRDSSCPDLLRCLPRASRVPRTGLSPSAGARSIAFRYARCIPWEVLQPRHAPKRRRFGLIPVRSPLLGESLLLSFPAGTKMFQFPAFASVIPLMAGSPPPGCPIRRSAGHGAFATRRSFSQLVTSFLASESQGIPHAPLMVPLYLNIPNLGSTCCSPLDLLVKLFVVFLLFSSLTDLTVGRFQPCHCPEW